MEEREERGRCDFRIATGRFRRNCREATRAGGTPSLRRFPVEGGPHGLGQHVAQRQPEQLDRRLVVRDVATHLAAHGVDGKPTAPHPASNRRERHARFLYVFRHGPCAASCTDMQPERGPGDRRGLSKPVGDCDRRREAASGGVLRSAGARTIVRWQRPGRSRAGRGTKRGGSYFSANVPASTNVILSGSRYLRMAELTCSTVNARTRSA